MACGRADLLDSTSSTASRSFLGEHAVQLLLGLLNTLAIVAVHHEDDALGVLVVVAPQWANLILATDIPHGERNVLVLDSLHVEADGGDGGHDLTKLELVEDGGLTGGIEADHKNAAVLLADELTEYLAENPHVCFTTVLRLASSALVVPM